MIGVIGGSIFFETPLFKGLKRESIETAYGEAELFSNGRIAFIPRHGSKQNIPPHMINHKANISALQKKGCKKVFGICSAGSLKKEIPPGSIALVTDFIGLFTPITFFDNEIVHSTPRMSGSVNKAIQAAAKKLGIPLEEGVYIQTPGPRLETKAEVKTLSQFADLVGMTAASEAALCSELGIDYACICSVDNYAHGLTKEELSNEAIVAAKNANAENVKKLAEAVLEELQ